MKNSNDFDGGLLVIATLLMSLVIVLFAISIKLSLIAEALSALAK